jgi:hypothetical protein
LWSHRLARFAPIAALFFPVDLGPDGEHDVAEDKRIQGDEGDVAAEVEGEHAADEEEQHAPGFFSPFEVLPGEDRHRSPVEFADLHANRDPHTLFHSGHSAIRKNAAASTPKRRPEIHHPLPLACEGRRLLPQADHPRRNRRPHARFAFISVPNLARARSRSRFR